MHYSAFQTFRQSYFHDSFQNIVHPAKQMQHTLERILLVFERRFVINHFHEYRKVKGNL